MTLHRLASIGGLVALLVGCGLFDSGVIWRGGPYVLGWIDESENVTLSYELGRGHSIGRIERCVFAVGWDGRYLVAKQHPECNRKITAYYFIDSKKDSDLAELQNVVVGPLTEAEFRREAVERNLPEFSKELAALK